MIIKRCDKCGEKIVEFPEQNMKLPYFKVTQWGIFGAQNVDLCGDCQEKLKLWMEDTSSEPREKALSFVADGSARPTFPSEGKAFGEAPTRLLTLEEAQNLTGIGWEELWFDEDEIEGLPEHTACIRCVFINGYGLTCEGYTINISPETYNRRHHNRLWIGEYMPSPEQREAEIWDE